MNNFFMKIRGDGQQLPSSYSPKLIGLAGIGSIIAIGIISFLTGLTGYPLVIGSFGATCILLFGFPDSPFSQPRNILGGHVISTLVGLVFYHLVSTQWWSMSLALGVAVILMMLTKTVHPPAASNPLIVFLLKCEWSFFIFPTFTGAIIIILVGLIFINLTREAKYPKY